MHEQGRVISHVLLSSHQNFILLNISRGKSNEVLAQSFYCSIKYDYILGTVSLASFDNLYFLNWLFSYLEFSPLVNKQRKIFQMTW